MNDNSRNSRFHYQANVLNVHGCKNNLLMLMTIEETINEHWTKQSSAENF
jgi:hypothetical protein